MKIRYLIRVEESIMEQIQVVHEFYVVGLRRCRIAEKEVHYAKKYLVLLIREIPAEYKCENLFKLDLKATSISGEQNGVRKSFTKVFSLKDKGAVLMISSICGVITG